MIDTHCHLDADAFEGEPVAAILERARAAGVVRVVTIGTSVETSRHAVRLAFEHASVAASVGVDPNDAEGWGADMLADVEALAEAPDVVAIGEIGLDYYWDAVPRDVQARAFDDQLVLAARCSLPVVIHNRDAHADTEAALAGWAADHPWRGRRPLGVLHCFSGTADMAIRLAEAGFMISFAGNVTYSSAEGLQEAAATVPLDALVLETDSPYLTPQPNRGRRNEPARVRDTAVFVAELRGISLESLARSTTENAQRLFGFGETLA